MRILPYELYKYIPNLSLCALRKEFGMYDYCLNKNIKNQGMQPFLDLGRNYFDISIKKWAEEMQKRENYINTFHLFYTSKVLFSMVETNCFLILECCIQYEIKNFTPYESNLSWYQIFIKTLKVKQKQHIHHLKLKIYNQLLFWYKNNFMRLNKNGLLKPKNLNMYSLILFFADFIKSQS
ncbi:MAG: hypothetical protein Q8899_01135 [Weeping tea tree witches'-broom phytoplasma]|uniref:hypothetical protein n=1 Tax=Candidatus Phytoplasma melaleucae TaxID=2982630 RepID=UPI00293B1E48|nr:hypothetical protein [Weeping tea tree witches'-broom phytoplasma]